MSGTTWFLHQYADTAVERWISVGLKHLRNGSAEQDWYFVLGDGQITEDSGRKAERDLVVRSSGAFSEAECSSIIPQTRNLRHFGQTKPCRIPNWLH